jgi:hypothetical protein
VFVLANTGTVEPIGTKSRACLTNSNRIIRLHPPSSRLVLFCPLLFFFVHTGMVEDIEQQSPSNNSKQTGAGRGVTFQVH